MALPLIALVALQTETLTGSATFRERMAIPASAELFVQLDRYSASAHTTVSEIRLSLAGSQVPVGFTMPYLASNIKSTDRYAVRAQIKVGTRVMFETGPATMAITNGVKKVELILRRVPIQPSPLLDKDWQMLAIEGRRLADSPGGKPTLRFESGGNNLRGNSGVNSFGGTYSISGPIAQIDTGMMTRMASTPEKMEVESEFLRLLPLVNRAIVEEGELILWRGEKELARFRAIKS